MAEAGRLLPLNRRAFLAATAAAALSPRAVRAAPPHAEDVRRAVGAPGAGVAFQRGGEITLNVAGRRAEGFPVAVEEDDLWHLGSLTKSMTALLAARLVEQGAISFEDTLGERLGGVAQLLAPVTLAQLLQHRGGVAANVPNQVAMRLQEMEDVAPPQEIRQAYIEVALQDAMTTPGVFLYSNAGYVAAAAMMETATGRAWEEMVVEEVFAPLGLSTAGFGPPGVSPDAPDQPWGHAKSDKAIAFPPAKTSDNILALNPAGRAHMSLLDFLAYLSAHGARASILTEDSWARIHRPVVDANASYAMGWVAPRKSIRMHSGSNTIWFATGGFNDAGDAIAIVTNIGNGADLPGPVELPVLDFLSSD